MKWWRDLFWHLFKRSMITFALVHEFEQRKKKVLIDKKDEKCNNMILT